MTELKEDDIIELDVMKPIKARTISGSVVVFVIKPITQELWQKVKNIESETENAGNTFELARNKICAYTGVGYETLSDLTLSTVRKVITRIEAEVMRPFLEMSENAKK